MIGPIPCKGMIVGDVAASDTRPFTPDEHALLDTILQRSGLELDWLHRTAIVPWALDTRRSPTRDEIREGLVKLVATGRAVDPTYTLLCGRVAAGAMFPRTLRVAGGRFREVRGLSYPRGSRAWMFTWHPRQVLANPLMQDEFAMDVSMFAMAVYKANVDKLHGKGNTVRIPFV